MADLEIAPSGGGGFVSQTPQLPSTAPQQEELQRTAQRSQETFQHAGFILARAIRQQEANTSTAALVDYHQQRTALDRQVATIPDINTRFNTFQTGLGNILDNVKQKYPSLTRTAVKQIEYQRDEDLNQHFFKNIAQQHTQNVADLKSNLDNLGRLAAASSGPTQDNLVHNATLLLQQSVANGTIHQAQADDQLNKFLHGVTLQQMQGQIAKNPSNVYIRKPDDQFFMGLTPKEINQAQSQALHIQNQRDAVNMEKFKQIKNDATTQALNGEMTPAQLQDAVNHAHITPGTYEWATGTKPPEQVNPAAANNLVGEVNSASSLNQLNDIAAHSGYYGAAHNFGAADYKNVNTAIAARREFLNTESNMNGAKQYDALESSIKAPLAKYGSLVHDVPAYQQLISELKQAKIDIEKPKDEGTRSENLQKWTKALTDLQQQIIHPRRAAKPVTPTAPAAAAPAAPTGPTPGVTAPGAESEAAPAVGPPGVAPSVSTETP